MIIETIAFVLAMLFAFLLAAFLMCCIALIALEIHGFINELIFMYKQKQQLKINTTMKSKTTFTQTQREIEAQNKRRKHRNVNILLGIAIVAYMTLLIWGLLVYGHANN